MKDYENDNIRGFFCQGPLVCRSRCGGTDPGRPYRADPASGGLFSLLRGGGCYPLAFFAAQNYVARGRRSWYNEKNDKVGGKTDSFMCLETTFYLQGDLLARLEKAAAPEK